jgi:hypothetical protein
MCFSELEKSNFRKQVFTYIPRARGLIYEMLHEVTVLGRANNPE